MIKENKSGGYHVKKYYVKVIACLLILILLIPGNRVEASKGVKKHANIALFQCKYVKGKVQLRWKPVKGADGYEVYKFNGKKKRYVRVKVIKKASASIYIDKGVKRRKTYYYKIRAYKINNGNKAYSSFSANKKIICIPIPARGKILTGKQKVTDHKYYDTNISMYAYRKSTTSVSLKWKKLKNAKKYVVYRKTSSKGKWKRIAVTAKTSYEDKRIKENKTYYYKYRAYNRYKNKFYYGPYSVVKKQKVLKIEEAVLKKYNYKGRVAKEALKIVNDYRASLGLKPYVWEPRLEKGALIRAKEISIQFRHLRPNGLATQTAYYYNMDLVERGITENIASGLPITSLRVASRLRIGNVLDRTKKDNIEMMEDTIKLWKASPGHNAILISEDSEGLCVTEFLGNYVLSTVPIIE